MLNGTDKISNYKYQLNQIFYLYSLYYAETRNEFVESISASLHPGSTASFEEMLQRWRAVGNTVSNLVGPRFEPQTFHSRNERVTARPSGRYTKFQWNTVQYDVIYRYICSKFS